MKIYDQQKLESLDKKKAAHTSCRHCVTRICKPSSKDDRPANSRDVNLLETFWISANDTTYKDPAPKTLVELRH